MNFWDEMPQREVELDAFYIDKYEVTNEQYLRFLSSPAGEQYRPRFWNHPKFNHPKQPVVGVTWEAADAYAKWAGKRLPTEAEWEKSARGTDGRIYPWGDVFFEDRLNYNFKFDRPTLVGQYPTGLSPYRVLDMAGNVSEWVADLYDPKLYAKGGNKNPFNNVEGTEYVHRGGMWNDWRFKHLNVRCARRLHAPPETQSPAMGFRCASTGPPRQPPTTQQ
jgi:formylglycine-generating enzyme required for sulfatase activity